MDIDRVNPWVLVGSGLVWLLVGLIGSDMFVARTNA